MSSSKIILKILFTLCVWSFVMLGLFKIHDGQMVSQEYVSVPINGRIILQKENKYGIDLTSTTTDRFDPYEILVDNRTGKCFLLFNMITG